MKIVTSNESSLVVKDSTIMPYVIGVVVILVGAIGIIKPALFVESMPRWASILFITIGSLPILFTPAITTTCDKESRTVCVSNASLLRKKLASIGFDEIKSVKMEQYYQYDPDSSRQGPMTGTATCLLLNNGNRVELSMNTSSRVSHGILSLFTKSGTSRSNRTDCLNAIAQFTQKPFENMGPPTAKEVLVTIKATVEKSINEAQSGKTQ